MRGNETWPRALVLFAGALLVLAVACRAGEPETDAWSRVVTEGEDGDGRVRAALARGCIGAGEEQDLTVRVERGVGVQYTSTYADGESGRRVPHGAGYGGDGRGVSLEGVVEGSWTVSEEAPQGLVVVYVNALLADSESVDPDEALTRLTLSYMLVGPEDECPPEGKPWPQSPVDLVTDTGDSHPEVRATLKHECVRAGGEQVLTVRAEGAVGPVVRYNSVYANGENGRPRPDGGDYGGAGFGVLIQGVVEQSWTIVEKSPPGVVTVLLKPSSNGEADESEEEVRLKLSFLLVGPEGDCP